MKNSQVLIRIIVIIFIVEVAIMILFYTLNPDLSVLSEAIIDALLLSLLSAPLIGKLIIQPYISMRDKAEKTLNELQHYDELLLNHVSEGIISLDNLNQISFVNPAVTAILGWNKEQLIGQIPHNVFHHNGDASSMSQADCLACQSCHNALEGEPYNMVFFTADGKGLEVECKSSTLIEENGENKGSLITFRDLSRQNIADKQIKQQLADLEQFNLLSVGRELKMIELKQEINKLYLEKGLEEKYSVEQIK